MIPIKPPSSERERKEWERQVSQRLTMLEILESQTVKREQKSNGTILEVKSTTSGSSDLPVWRP
jgi:hypothetical protein